MRQHALNGVLLMSSTLFWSDRFIRPPIQESGQASTGKMKKIHVSNRSIVRPPPSRLTVQSLLNLYQNRKNPFPGLKSDFAPRVQIQRNNPGNNNRDLERFIEQNRR